MRLGSALWRRTGSSRQPSCSASVTTPSVGGRESGRLRTTTEDSRQVVDGVELARLAQELAEHRRAPRARTRRPGLGPQPVRRPGHPGRARHGDGAGRDPGGPAPRRLADEPRGRRRARARARRPRHRRREVHQRRRRATGEAMTSARSADPRRRRRQRPGAVLARRVRQRRQQRSSAKKDVTLHVFAAASLTESFTDARQAVREGPPGHQGRVQLRSELRPGRADRQRRPGRRVRLAPARATWTRWSSRRRREGPQGLRDEQHGDRHTARTTRPRSPRSTTSRSSGVKVARLPAAGARVARWPPRSSANAEDHREAGHRGGRREVGADQGHPR